MAMVSLHSNFNCNQNTGVLEGVKREAGWDGEFTAVRENSNSPSLGEGRGLVASYTSKTERFRSQQCGLFIGTQTSWQILVPKLVIADVFYSEGINENAGLENEWPLFQS